MAWQHYSTWDPVAGVDLGDQFREYSDYPNAYQEDTTYYGSGRPEYNDPQYNELPRPGLTPEQDGYEMDEWRSHISSTTLHQSRDPLLDKSGNEQSVRESVSRDPIKYRFRFSGWKVGVALCAVTATSVCLLNVTMTIWAVANHRLIDGLSYLYTGGCDEVARMSLWIHLGINTMSTLLLSASNYTMQVISSPTREEVDAAHQQSRWLDIGIPSTRNLIGISWGRIIMWMTLALSSIPLHLMYNTAIFSTLSANSYDFFVVTENFMNMSAPYNVTALSYSEFSDWVSTGVIDTMHAKALDGNLVKYDAQSCMTEYGIEFVSKVRNVLLVSTDTRPSNNVFGAGTWGSANPIPYWWICGDGWSANPYRNKSPVCTVSGATAATSSWKVLGHPISYCMVEPADEECRLSFSLSIMLFVIAANVTKAFVMILTVWKLKNPTLVTIGDAVASFLDNPDPTTEGICLSTKEDINNERDIKTGKWKRKSAKRWLPKRYFWFRAASVKRWLTCNILCISVIFLGAYLLTEGMANIGIYDVKELYSLGFGAVNANSVVSWTPRGLLATVLLANLPQGILSFLYLTYNGLFSCVLGAHEWSRYALTRKPLRVTAPTGNQRSTYYLQLPYTYAIPLLILSGTLHWLMSQSLFLALVTVFDDVGKEDTSSTISKVGYSCIGILFALIAGSVAIVAGIINGFRRYPPGMPLVGSCSAAISAACHRTPQDASASLHAVKWGVVDTGAETGVGHCSFSSFEVLQPVAGQQYAGTTVKHA